VIAVDTSALMAVILDEPAADACIERSCRLLFTGEDFSKTDLKSAILVP
jgi:uncharacterized protein with PIN domain